MQTSKATAAWPPRRATAPVDLFLDVDLDDTELSPRAWSPGWVNTIPCATPHMPVPGKLTVGESRQAEAVRFAMQNGHDHGYRVGYVDGFACGKWCGGVAGALGATLGFVLFVKLHGADHAVGVWLRSLGVL